MKRRFTGFVVGKQSVQQQKGWKIGRRTRKSKVYYFAPEAEIAEGFEVHASADVTFYAKSRDGRNYAQNVQPKTAHMEASMRKLKLRLDVVLFAGILALFIAAAHYYPTQPHDWLVERGAKSVLGDIRQLDIDDMITDEVVRAAVRGAAGFGEMSRQGGGLHAAFEEAEKAVFDEHVCRIFDLGFDDPDKACHIARNAVSETEYNVWYQDEEIPVSIAPIIAEMRTQLDRIGRAHLTTPNHLRILYTAKKDVVIDEYKRMKPERKIVFLRLVSNAIKALQQLRDDADARDVHSQFLEIEKRFLTDTTTSIEEVYSVWQAAWEDLRVLVENVDLFLFAGRRHAEGGNELLRMYIDALVDLKAALDG